MATFLKLEIIKCNPFLKRLTSAKNIIKAKKKNKYGIAYKLFKIYTEKTLDARRLIPSSALILSIKKTPKNNIYPLPLVVFNMFIIYLFLNCPHYRTNPFVWCIEFFNLI